MVRAAREDRPIVADGDGQHRELAARTWEEVADRPVLLVPLGACEQHGPHLPLGTDTVIARAIADAAAARLPNAVVGPPIAVTASGEHAGFPGTLSIGTPTTARVIVELVRSADWAAGVALVNGHGGNRDAVTRAVATLAAERRRVLAWWPRVEGGDGHAGHTETSLLLALTPEDVQLERAVAGATAPLAELADTLRADGVRAVSPNGVLGDPAGATAAGGAAMLAELVDDLVGRVDAVAWRA
jgi:creatinine amidohydrolase